MILMNKALASLTAGGSR